MLKTKDLFTLSEIVDKMGLDGDIQTILAARKNKDVTENEIGEKLIFAIIKKLHMAKKEITQLLANVSDKSIKDIEDLPVKETIALIKELLTEEGVLSFLSQSLKG